MVKFKYYACSDHSYMMQRDPHDKHMVLLSACHSGYVEKSHNNDRLNRDRGDT
uniref:Uncharacterized protein n=1 Tax=Candidatus Methanogaster sp. ANME-2c ERB4 TaxID=2759911 RepID=A0A7G9YGN0_9EURY|nr:hypothetical protein FLPJBPEJ_00008 [Methanosarcinales archaeon ANME-2c ERB4]